MDLFIAKSRADLLGGSGLGTSSFGTVGRLGGKGIGASSLGAVVRAGRGGRFGRTGGDAGLVLSSACDLMFVVDREGRSGARGFRVPCSSFFFFSGSGGKVAGSYGGALTRLPPSDVVVRVDKADAVDRADTVDAIDSIEPRLLPCASEGLRGGRDGGAGDVPR